MRFPEYANEEEDVAAPYGTYRSWTFIGRILSRYFQKIAPHKPKSEIENDIRLIVSAHSSPKSATEYENFYKIYIRFNPEDVLEKGQFYEYSTDRAERIIEIYASTYAVSKAFIEKYTELVNNKKHKDAKILFNRYTRFFNKIYSKFKSEPGVAGMLVNALHYMKTELIRRDPEFRKELIKRLNPRMKGKIETFDQEFILKRFRAVAS